MERARARIEKKMRVWRTQTNPNMADTTREAARATGIRISIR